MIEDYRTKMDALHMHFNSALRPKLEALKRQIVTVESRINDVSSARDLLLAEAVAEHQVHVDQVTDARPSAFPNLPFFPVHCPLMRTLVESRWTASHLPLSAACLQQVHLCSERKFSLLRGDLDELMRDVQRIYAFTTSLSQPQPKSSAEVMSFMSRYMDLQAQCSQLSSKGFKTQVFLRSPISTLFCTKCRVIQSFWRVAPVEFIICGPRGSPGGRIWPFYSAQDIRISDFFFR